MRPVGTVRAAVLLACLAVAGCGVATGAGAPPRASARTADYPAPDPTALDAWVTFPADARPRPIILSELPHVPAAGFTDGATKQAVLEGRYRLEVPLPRGPGPTVGVTLPEGPARLPGLTARQALDALSTAAPGSVGPTARITRLVLGTATFSSDRGPLPLPAWLFTLDGATGPLAWPAIARSAFWPPESGVSVIGGGARVAADGRTVEVVLPDDSGSGCPGSQQRRTEPVALESPSAVVVGVRSVPVGAAPTGPGQDCAVPAVGHHAEFSVPLAAPLGGRVLLTAIGVGYTVVLAVVPD